MDDLSAILRYAAGVASPIRLQMRDRAGNITLHEVAGPYCLIGRGHECDINIPIPDVAFRHVYLQAIGNRLAVISLPSAAGTTWEGAAFNGWFGLDHQLQVCGHTLQLVDPIWHADTILPPPTEFRPREMQRPEYGLLPEVELELLNTSAKGRKWPINRVVTLLGRDEACRITIVDDRVSRAHCAFLLLPTGLWVIDLLSKTGTQVAGQKVPCALLANEAEFHVGPYRLAAHYPQIAALAQAATQPLEFGSEFLTGQNKILLVETYQNILVVSPCSDSNGVLYQDVHVESSRVSDLLTRKYRNLIIDLSQTNAIGPHALEALAAICRATSGQSVLCGVSAELSARHERATLMHVCKQYGTRFEAIHALNHANA